MSNTVFLVSGPNLDLLGARDPEMYGHHTLAELVERFTSRAANHSLEVTHVQSNFEGELVETLHSAREKAVGVVINPGALTHYSWSLRDALDAFSGVRIELHLSNPAAREPFRHTSTIAGVVDGTIAGFGALGYDLAVDALVHLLDAKK